ncbi:DUF21-domain-containing protein [Thozetella sp. PMI_491]|nr:DUF21-domain-containing protein [Thozetella sp. PMI_491]
MILVLLGGAFAGLTIALMGQDGIYLQVVSRDPNEPQQKNARRVYDLLDRGKHWVLVTLLLSNVIVNETLPVVLDRCLGGGVAAVVGSTFLIVIFGEILPQSICVRYGLQIGGYMSKPVLLLMYLLAPIAWPTAKLLDWLLGEDHGTVYKKSGLKTLVTLHKNLGDVSQRLNQDEVTIISAVLDLKEKPVANVMTPMDDVFVMCEDTVLDEKTMDIILSAGYSRIPIHESGKPTNFVGMLLVKILITYDPEDCSRVRDFPLATLPETRPETSCLDIVNFFQEGKSHMVLVSEYPGEDHGALGVVTLEDVIEELIGEEIIDESDVYIDVHKAIRRLAPAPKAKVRQTSDDFGKSDDNTVVADQEYLEGQKSPHDRAGSVGTAPTSHTHALSSSPKATTFMMRRRSTGLDGQGAKTGVPVRANIEEMRQHLKHLGPSNRATNPKETRSTTVKIKPGLHYPRSSSVDILGDRDDEGDENTPLLRAPVSGKDGIQALSQSYGSAATSDIARITSPANAGAQPTVAIEPVDDACEQIDQATQTSTKGSQGDLPPATASRPSSSEGSGQGTGSNSIPTPRRIYVRSGSITENVVESRGVRKVVLETTSSQDEEDLGLATGGSAGSPEVQKSQSKASLGRLFTEQTPVPEEDEGEASADLLSPSTENDMLLSPTDEAESSQAAQGSNGGSKPGKKKNRRKKRRGGGGS